MADKDEEKQEPEKGGTKKLIVLVLAGILLGGVGIGGSLYFTGMLGGSASHGENDEEGHEAEAEEPKTVPVYFKFPQAFTVNFETDKGLRYLQVSLEIMSYDIKAIDAVQVHMPVIKNNIILLLSGQTYDDLISVEGKTKLREMALKEIQNILDKYHTEAAIEEVYFTNFVMQ